MINVRDFIDSNERLDTLAFQKAIDLGSSRGGECVYVPFGEYKLSTVVLKDNTNLVFEDGVKIISADKFSDFLPDEPVTFKRYQDHSHSSYTCAMFYADGISNVSIKGGATIDMCAMWNPENDRSPNGDGYHRGVKTIALKHVNNLRIEGLTIIRATDISVLLGACKDVFISKMYIHSHVDGISPDGCEDVVISDCIIKTGDDALVFKTSLFDNEVHACERITVNNCIVSSRANAIKFGTESVGDFKYFNISNCVVLNTEHSGIAIESADGANIYGINVSNITMCNVANPIFIYTCERLRAPEGTTQGEIRDINISNIYADVHDKPFQSIDSWFPDIKEGSDIGVNKSYPCMVYSTSAEKKIKNVSLNNINIKVLGGGKLTDEVRYAAPTRYPECSNFRLPCYGMYIKNAENLKINGLNFETVYPDERKEIIEE